MTSWTYSNLWKVVFLYVPRKIKHNTDTSDRRLISYISFICIRSSSCFNPIRTGEGVESLPFFICSHFHENGDIKLLVVADMISK